MPNLDEATHIHEFNRIPFYVKHGINFRREWRWKCQNPDCNAIWKRFQVKDKRSVCSVCHENTLILDNDALKRAKQPHVAELEANYRIFSYLSRWSAQLQERIVQLAI